MRLFVSVCGALLSMTATAAAQVPTLPYDHVHLNVPDQAKAVEWYAKNFDGKPTPEAADRLMFGTTRLITSASHLATSTRR